MNTTDQAVANTTTESALIESAAKAKPTEAAADKPKAARKRAATPTAAKPAKAAPTDAAKAKQAEKDAAALAEFTAKVEALTKDGMNVAQIAAKLKSTPSKVYKIRVALGVKRTTRAASSTAPAHDKSPEAEALRAAIAAVVACGVSMNVAARWAREDQAAK